MTVKEIVTSQTSRSVKVRFVTSNTKVNGRYVTNAPYRFLDSYAPPMIRIANDTGYGELYTAGASDTRVSPASDSTINRLYGKLREEVLGAKGELLTSSLEWKSSLDMITSRALQIGGAYSALRKGKVKKAAKLLKMKVPRGIKVDRKGQSATGLWLEYWMGWAPLMGDIGHAIDVLSKAEPPTRSFSVAVVQNDKVDLDQFIVLDPTRGLYHRYRTVKDEKSSFAAYGKVRVTNHNLNIADQLGFTNPAVTAWQILPFSFIIDWFANVGTVLGSLTDFAGLELFDTGTAMAGKASGTRTLVEYGLEYYYAYPGEWPRSSRVILKDDLTATFVTQEKYRTPGPLPTPRFQIKMLDRLSLTRAATSVSLLREIFLRK